MIKGGWSLCLDVLLTLWPQGHDLIHSPILGKGPVRSGGMQRKRGGPSLFLWAWREAGTTWTRWVLSSFNSWVFVVRGEGGGGRCQGNTFWSHPGAVGDARAFRRERASIWRHWLRIYQKILCLIGFFKKMAEIWDFTKLGRAQQLCGLGRTAVSGGDSEAGPPASACLLGLLNASSGNTRRLLRPLFSRLQNRNEGLSTSCDCRED